MKIFDTYPLFAIEPVKGFGSWIWDRQGNRYLDLYGGHAVISIGHRHPVFVERLKNQLDRIAFYSNSVEIPLQTELAEKLGVASGYPDYSLFLCNSGAEANENAMKLASFRTGRKKIVAFSKSFHGRTSLAVEATDDKSIQAAVNQNGNVRIVPFNDLLAAEREIDENTAAVILEGIQGVGGVQIPGNAFLIHLSDLCKRNGVMLILDEVQSGYGRSGRFFAHQYSGIRPDLITVAKGMGNGFPIGGVLISPEFEARHGMLGTTFGGNYLACAAGIAVLDVLNSENLIENAKRMGEYVLTEVQTIPGVKEVRGQGLMIGIELEAPCAPVRSRLLKEYQVFTGASSDKNTLRILPALNIGKAEIDMFLDAFKRCLS